jgi:hypothetical protein
MEIGTASEFTFLTLLFGTIMMVAGICYTLYPPKKIS